MSQITVSINQWSLTWSGGRLADVRHAESDTALDCVQVGAYDWQHGQLVDQVSEDTLLSTLSEWIAESGDDFARELPYLI
jgi:hypothetical protein